MLKCSFFAPLNWEKLDTRWKHLWFLWSCFYFFHKFYIGILWFDICFTNTTNQLVYTCQKLRPIFPPNEIHGETGSFHIVVVTYNLWRIFFLHWLQAFFLVNWRRICIMKKTQKFNLIFFLAFNSFSWNSGSITYLNISNS